MKTSFLKYSIANLFIICNTKFANFAHGQEIITPESYYREFFEDSSRVFTIFGSQYSEGDLDNRGTGTKLFQGQITLVNDSLVQNPLTEKLKVRIFFNSTAFQSRSYPAESSNQEQRNKEWFSSLYSNLEYKTSPDLSLYGGPRCHYALPSKYDKVLTIQVLGGSDSKRYESKRNSAYFCNGILGIHKKSSHWDVALDYVIFAYKNRKISRPESPVPTDKVPFYEPSKVTINTLVKFSALNWSSAASIILSGDSPEVSSENEKTRKDNFEVSSKLGLNIIGSKIWAGVAYHSESYAEQTFTNFQNIPTYSFFSELQHDATGLFVGAAVIRAKDLQSTADLNASYSLWALRLNFGYFFPRL